MVRSTRLYAIAQGARKRAQSLRFSRFDCLWCSVSSFPLGFLSGILMLTNSFCNPWKPKSTWIGISSGTKSANLSSSNSHTLEVSSPCPELFYVWFMGSNFFFSNSRGDGGRSGKSERRIKPFLVRWDWKPQAIAKQVGVLHAEIAQQISLMQNRRIAVSTYLCLEVVADSITKLNYQKKR